MLINATLIIDGEKLKTQIEIDEADLKAMQNKKKTGYERVGDLKKYYWIDGDGLIHMSYNNNTTSDDFCYNVANYYSSKDIAQNNARADQLMRQLRRFAVENRKEKLDWKTRDCNKYSIYYSYPGEMLYVDCSVDCKEFGQIYFDSEELAKQAIEEFKDELIWYFTEYKNSL